MIKKGPSYIRDGIISTNTLFQEKKSLAQLVAYGEQKKADKLLINSSFTQKMLQEVTTFTDYSNRTFTCTAYEYAYWAKDTYMCRMLQKHMDEDTKAFILERVNLMEENGLNYQQEGQEINSKHFSLSPLINVLQEYINNWNIDKFHQNIEIMRVEWLKIGMAQREIPAHVAQEYCRLDRSFEPVPTFKEACFPRNLTFFNYLMKQPQDQRWFPCNPSQGYRLGLDFALSRDKHAMGGYRGSVARTGYAGSYTVSDDLAAMRRLDEVRTSELEELRENLRLNAQLSLEC